LKEPVQAVDGAKLLDDVRAFLCRFVSYPDEHAAVAHALWVVHAHLMDAWETSPRVAFLSPEPASGKSRALEVTELLVPRAVITTNVSPAYLFRRIVRDDGTPTILFDEIDTVFGPKAVGNEDIRALLNAGHRRGAVVGRCVTRGKIVETEEIDAFAAVALAGLGWLPETITTRAVVVRMRPRAPGERIEPFRRRKYAAAGHALRQQLELWAGGVLATIEGRWPALPPGVDDRAADVWEPLLAVAEAAGGSWPDRARAAAVAIVAASKETSPSLGVRLLADLRTVFGDRDAMRTTDILDALLAMDEAPWADLKGKPLDARKLATRLREYGIRRKRIRSGTDVTWGYDRADFDDAWTRYLPPPQSPQESATSATDDQKAREIASCSVADVADYVAVVADGPTQSATPEATDSAIVAAVAVVADYGRTQTDWPDAPPIGTIEADDETGVRYRYAGGDPMEQASWEPLQ
jgi:hypothetical protein